MTTSGLTELTTAEQDVVCGGLGGGTIGSYDHSKGFGNVTKQTNNLTQTAVALNFGWGKTEADNYAVQKNVNDIF